MNNKNVRNIIDDEFFHILRALEILTSAPRLVPARIKTSHVKCSHHIVLCSFSLRQSQVYNSYIMAANSPIISVDAPSPAHAHLPAFT